MTVLSIFSLILLPGRGAAPPPGFQASVDRLRGQQGKCLIAAPINNIVETVRCAVEQLCALAAFDAHVVRCEHQFHQFRPTHVQAQGASVAQLKDFTGELKALYPLLRRHANLAEEVTRQSSKQAFRDRIRAEQLLLDGVSLDTVCDIIEVCPGSS